MLQETVHADCMQGTFCNVPAACDGGVALADGTCCMYDLARSGQCCEVVDADMQCCASNVLDAAGVCQGTAVSIDYNGEGCAVGGLETCSLLGLMPIFLRHQ